MKEIWKYIIRPVDHISMPEDAEILCVQMQGDKPCIWVLLDPTKEKRTRLIRSYGTGHPIPEDPGRYIGTFQMKDGLIFHTFEGGGY